MLAAAAAKLLQSCPTLWDPIDSSPPGSPVPGILQARTLEWVAVSFSNAWKWRVKVKSLSHVWLLATPWMAAHQAPPSVGFSRQEYWSGVPLPSLMGCLYTGINGRGKWTFFTKALSVEFYWKQKLLVNSILSNSLCCNLCKSHVKKKSMNSKWLQDDQCRMW